MCYIALYYLLSTKRNLVLFLSCHLIYCTSYTEPSGVPGEDFAGNLVEHVAQQCREQMIRLESLRPVTPKRLRHSA